MKRTTGTIARAAALLAAAAVAAAAYHALAGIAISRDERLHWRTVYEAETEQLAGQIEAVLASNNYGEVSRLRDARSLALDPQSGEIWRAHVRYVLVIDEMGIAVLHSDAAQVGRPVRGFTSGPPARNEVTVTPIIAGRTRMDMYDVTAPLRIGGAVRGAVRAGFVPPGAAMLESGYRAALRARTLATGVIFVLGAACAAVLFLRRPPQAERDGDAQLALIGAGLAHEIKNALNGIRMNAELLDEQLGRLDSPLAAQYVTKVRRIEREAARTGAVLNEFLVFAKPAAFKPAVINLPALIEDIAQFFDAECRTRGITLERSCDASLAHVIADDQQLRHALSNLVLNAVRAVDRNGAITLAAQRDRKQVRISVRDTGPGMPPDVARQAFQAFYSTRPDGVGLGLAIVRRVAEQHGGTVTVDNRPGHGCTFVVSFPLTDDPR
ncbi:GHKL domain-containing protein [bacterium]|nr:GHKL domain-containing protein [bacterium]